MLCCLNDQELRTENIAVNATTFKRVFEALALSNRADEIPSTSRQLEQVCAPVLWTVLTSRLAVNLWRAAAGLSRRVGVLPESVSVFHGALLAWSFPLVSFLR